MPLSIDSYLGVQQDSLNVQSKRMEVLAKNLANADTPNYKAQDIDFRAALAKAGSPGASLQMSNTASGQNIGTSTSTTDGNVDLSSALKYRTPLAPSLDGNTVDVQMEQSAFAENTVRYQATLQFLTGSLKDLMTAITGQ
jgi:flagellar basal-body rod protein FlgB